MALVALDGTPLVMVGAAERGGVCSVVSLTTTTIDATNEAAIMVGRILTADQGSHTIDTTGSSSIGWRSSTLTFANAGTTVKVGLAAVDAAAGPPVRAANASDVITFDVSKSLTGGGGGITANAWQEHVPDTGTKTIANGDLVAMCIQMTARGGADAVNIQCAELLSASTRRPSVTDFTGGSYSGTTRIPNAVITFSDGVLGYFWGGYVATTGLSNTAWNNTSATKEHGNLLQFAYPQKVYGVVAWAAIGGDADLVLYSDPLGTPVAEKSVSIDLNAVAAATAGLYRELFPSPFVLKANTPYAIVFKPTTATNITAPLLILNSSAHQTAWNNGANGYAVNRNTGAFAAQNSSKDRYAIGLLVGAFEHGVSPTYALGI